MVLIIAVGTFAIGMIIGTPVHDLRHATGVGMSSPATVYLWTSPGIDEDGLAALGRVDGVTAIDGIAQAGIEWRLPRATRGSRRSQRSPRLRRADVPPTS